MTMEPVAIVGTGCVLPTGLGSSALWKAVRAAKICIQNTPDDRWGLLHHNSVCDPKQPKPEFSVNDKGGYVPKEHHPSQSSLDAVFVWTKEAASQALKNVQIENPHRTGLVLGNLSFPTVKMNQYTEWSIGKRQEVDPMNRFMSGLPARWTADALGISGPAYALDCACASALYAIAHACRLLHRRQCDLVLAGAVNAADDLFLHIGFSALQALSPSGRSRPFHAQADGLLPAEGAGMVALRRFSDALDGDEPILGIIRGVGLSNDGRDRGLLVPSQSGQVRAMRRAYEQADLEPDSVGWIECHATGTTVGDGTELRSMSQIFSQHVPISSLKANLGHLITASGVAGLLKVLEAFGHEEMPPSPTIDAPHSLLKKSPFWIPQEVREWKTKQRAGISAFGFGGNNAHCIVDRFQESAFVPARVSSASQEPIALVGMDVRLGSLDGLEALLTFLKTRKSYTPRIDDIPISLAGLRFPPNDLKQSIGQQNLVFSLMQRFEQNHSIPENTGVWIGMGTDLAVTRYGLRWRSREWPGVDMQESVISSLKAQGVLGCMPNVVSNRLNAQWGWNGPSGTISAEELSGIYALQVAVDALREHEVDAALIGAVDLSTDPLHCPIHPSADPADGAVVWLLKRVSDVQPHEQIIAKITDVEQPSWTSTLPAVPHCASALLECTAGVLDSIGKERGITVHCRGMRDHVVSVHMLLPNKDLPPSHSIYPQPVLTMPAHLPNLPNILHAPDLPSDAELEQLQAKRKCSSPPEPEKPAHTKRHEPALVKEIAPLHEDVTALGIAGVFQAHLLELSQQHKTYMEQQAQIHNAFLAQRAAFDALLVREGTMEYLDAGEQERQPAVLKERAPVVPLHKGPVPPNAVATPSQKMHKTVQTAVAPMEVHVSSGKGAHSVAPFAPSPVGLSLTRAQLVVHSRGAISTIYGDEFHDQDAYEIQTRMPEPPLLLADRVTGIDAKPASMGTGTLWSETDIKTDSWYIHQDRMPAGIMIESGQADLMLISYLGIDLLCQGQRSYRLLGCELMYHDDLPQVGDTLRYDIHVDGHAKHGDVRLFFFHYDCRVDGKPRLTVRDGQAGFFTTEELAESAGILWRPEEQEIDPNAVVDAPLVPLTKRVFSFEEIEAFSQGRPWDCFGESHRRTKTHTRTPRIQSDDMLFLRGDVHIQTDGGPWGRGYLRLEVDISPDDWFFEGHFKNDPCMPGTLMFEGCLQGMAFYLGALGCTIERDGWRFQPMRNRPYPLRCRGQVTPGSKKLVYEIFVEEVVTGPIPHLVADLLCTVDGLGAFHARGMGLELVPDFPMKTMPSLLNVPDNRPCAVDKNGFPFDRRAMIASALGQPSQAFGTMYTPFDSHKRVARLPGPPYHFMSRVSRIRGVLGTCEVGTEIALEYDVPKNAWYFDANGTCVMPFAVFLEAALQPCGWLASAVGSALTVEEELFFRNLDGKGTLHDVLRPDDDRLTTVVKITGISQSGGMIIESFDVQCFVGERCLYTLNTVFGFFPAHALANQIGLPTSPEHRAQLSPHPFLVNLKERPEQYFSRSARLAGPMLCMLDRITAFDPDAEHPFLRGEKDVDPGEWFFKAHFFQDPVQPGSLGIEAMIQLLQWYMLHTDMHKEMNKPVFEPLAVERDHIWKYRGQVIPENRLITTTMEIVEQGSDKRGVYAIANASLWVDGKRIYEATGLGMRMVEQVILERKL